MNPNKDANKVLIVANSNSGVIAEFSLRKTSKREANSIKKIKIIKAIGK